MSYNPATPAKDGTSNNNAPIPHAAGRQGSALGEGKTGHVSEPSPASTYGETVGGDSVPPTPLAADDLDGGSCFISLNNLLHASALLARVLFDFLNVKDFNELV